MKTRTVVITSIVAIAGLGAVFAANSFAGGWKHGGHGMRGFGGPAMMIEKLDADADGTLARAEVDSYVASQFETNDADRNGSINLAEFEGVFMDLAQTPMVRAFQRLDRDGDGEITAEEVNSPIDRMFAFADRNDDGAIEPSEMHRGRKGHGGHRRHNDGEHEGGGEN